MLGIERFDERRDRREHCGEIVWMDVRSLHQENRKAWNEGAEAYEAELQERIEFLRAGGTNFVRPEYSYLEGLSDWCERAIHLQCAGGTDTLSLWNLGAREVVGIDISERMIGVARRKSEALGAPATWIHCDLFDTPHELDGTADLVYTGRGALNWIQDLHPWAEVVYRLLKPGGKLYIFEGHPISFVWDLAASEFKLDPVYGYYFADTAFSEAGWPETYIGDLGKPKHEHSVKHERQWTFGAVINPLIEVGMRLLRIEEHPETYWDIMPKMPPEHLARLPNTYSLLMAKLGG